MDTTRKKNRVTENELERRFREEYEWNQSIRRSMERKGTMTVSKHDISIDNGSRVIDLLSWNVSNQKIDNDNNVKDIRKYWSTEKDYW